MNGSPRRAELALAAGGLGVGVGEFAIMGLLPNVADDLGISIPQAGHVISAYALGVVVGSPIIAVLAARLARRMLLLALMLAAAVPPAPDRSAAWLSSSPILARCKLKGARPRTPQASTWTV